MKGLWHDVWHAYPHVVVYVINDAMTILTHDIANCVTETLEDLAPMSRPEGHAHINVRAVPLEPQKVIVTWINIHVMKHATYINFILERTLS